MNLEKKISFDLEEKKRFVLHNPDLDQFLSSGIQVAIYLKNFIEKPTDKFNEFIKNLAEVAKETGLPFGEEDFISWFKISSLTTSMSIKEKNQKKFADTSKDYEDLYISIKRNMVLKLRNKALFILWVLYKYSLEHHDKLNKIIVKLLTDKYGGFMKYELKNGIFIYPETAKKSIKLYFRDPEIINDIEMFGKVLTKELQELSLEKFM